MIVHSALSGLEIEIGPSYSAVLARDNKLHKFIDFLALLDGLEIGKLQVIVDHPGGKLEANHVKVHPDFRKQGVATALYKFASSHLGKEFRPSSSHSDDGEAMWKAWRGDKLTAALRRVIGLSDYDEELFGQGGCWELAKSLSEQGMEFAVIQELKYGEVSYPHAFAIDGEVAVDVYGRTSLDKMKSKWQRLLSGEVSVVRGKDAIEASSDVSFGAQLMKLAKALIDENRAFFFGRKK